MEFDLFKRENDVIEKAQSYLEDDGESLSPESMEAFQTLLADYKKLSKRSQRLIKLSDRNELQLRDATTRIAEQKEEIQRTQKSLVQAEKLASLGELVAGVAHELNTPLGIILTAASSLKTETNILDKLISEGRARKSNVAGYIKTAQEISRLVEIHSQTASDLIGSFKSVSADRASDEQRTFEIGAYIKDVLRSLEPALKGKRVSIDYQCQVSHEMTSYPGSLNQILTNLVLNACKHGYKEGTVEGTVTVKLSLKDENIIIQVSDNGLGIPKDIQHKIFDPFVTTARDSGGTGLGLNVVHNLVVGRLGGDIHLDSDPEIQHTTFKISLPIAK